MNCYIVLTAFSFTMLSNTNLFLFPAFIFSSSRIFLFFVFVNKISKLQLILSEYDLTVIALVWLSRPGKPPPQHCLQNYSYLYKTGSEIFPVFVLICLCQVTGYSVPKSIKCVYSDGYVTGHWSGVRKSITFLLCFYASWER